MYFYELIIHPVRYDLQQQKPLNFPKTSPKKFENIKATAPKEIASLVAVSTAASAVTLTSNSGTLLFLSVYFLALLTQLLVQNLVWRFLSTFNFLQMISKMQ